jgi:hypothetical protein
MTGENNLYNLVNTEGYVPGENPLIKEEGTPRWLKRIATTVGHAYITLNLFLGTAPVAFFRAGGSEYSKTKVEKALDEPLKFREDSFPTPLERGLVNTFNFIVGDVPTLGREIGYLVFGSGELREEGRE